MFSLNDLFKLADNNCTEAMVVLASYFYNGTNGVSADRKKSFELLKKAADLYDPNAQMLVSEFYLKGIEVGKDVGRFEEYCRNSMNQNNLLAKCKLAAYYESIKQYDKAAEMMMDQRLQNSPFSTLHLSVCRYRSGDLTGAYKALDRFYKTDSKQTILRAHCLFKGEGVVAYPDEAIKLLNKIKDSDAPEIAYMIGKYEGSLGNSMLKDHKEASLMYMEEAVEKGFGPAMYELGVKFRDGIGVEADVTKGKDLILKASLKGYGAEEYNPFLNDSYLASNEMDFSNVIAETGKEALTVLDKRASTINPKLSETEKLVFAAIGTAAANIIYGNKNR